MKHIPNFLTSLNIAAGFISAAYAMNGDVTTASWLILAAMVFDFLDGFSARLLKAYSEIGKELDSLADIVSFGVAPALIVSQLLGSSLSLTSPFLKNAEGILQVLILLSPVIMPVCAGLRLAKFNVDASQATTFKGLATPANALAIAGIVIAGSYSDMSVAAGLSGSTAALLSVTLILSLLMVIRIPMFSLKFSNLKFKGNEERYILVILAIIVMSVFGIAGAALIIPLYIVISLVSLLFR